MTPARRWFDGGEGLRSPRNLDPVADEARSEVTGEDALRPVRVEGSTIPATYLLPEVVARLRRAEPELRVIVRVSDSATALRSLPEEGCDVAVVGRPPADPRLSTRVLAEG